MKEMRIVAETARTKPNYRPMAQALLTVCREWYGNPENEQAFMEWKKTGQHKENR